MIVDAGFTHFLITPSECAEETGIIPSRIEALLNLDVDIPRRARR